MRVQPDAHSPFLCVSYVALASAGATGFIRTISTLLGPLRLSLNPFFSSPSSRQPLISSLQNHSNVRSIFPADFRCNLFLISNFRPLAAVSPRSNEYRIIIVLTENYFHAIVGCDRSTPSARAALGPFFFPAAAASTCSDPVGPAPTLSGSFSGI